MKNIDKIAPFKSTIKNTDFGTLLTLEVEVKITAKESISLGERSLLTNYIYKEDGTYNLVYTLVDTNGNTESFIEDDGILPSLFLSPSNENYVSVVPYHPDKELEISISVFNRENTVLPKGNRPFTGKFIGTSEQFSIFYNVDLWSDKKPDKILAIEFKNEIIKKKHTIKVPLPRNNNIFIENNQIHLLAKDGDSWLHRQIDAKGKEIQKRKISIKSKNFNQVLSLSFSADSYLLSLINEKISIETITKDGDSEVIELADLHGDWFNSWSPVKISPDTFITIFNNEHGNGWIATKKNQLLEAYFSDNIEGYKNILTDETLLLGKEKLVISSVNKTKDNNYAIVFYPMTNPSTKNKELIILNREIKQ